MINSDEIQQQSMAAWNQWRPLWIKNVKVNKELKNGSFSELLNIGKGKTLLIAAFGYSLSENIESIKKNRDKFDIFCCDKSFGYLMDNGIVPNYCQIADASVETKWMTGRDTSKTILISNIAANPEWGLEWKGKKYYYTNWDNIGTAKILGKLGNCYDLIPASSNVSNGMIVFASQVLGYKKHLLVGFDYSWDTDGKYYASGNPGGNKKNYMYHATVITNHGRLSRTSTNLLFSCKWMMDYLMKFKNLLTINCTDRGIFNIPLRMSIEKGLNY